MNYILKFFISFCFTFITINFVSAQLKSYKIGVHGDTLNKVDKNGLKQGKWVIHTEPLRGEEGFEDEGIFKDGKKEGVWRHYTLTGDAIGFETYLHGGKDGKQQYYTPYGELLREESWKGFNPDAPNDTIPIYGTGSNEIISYKIQKAEPYSVKQGTWRYYESFTGKLLKTEEWDRNNIVVPNAPKKEVTQTTTTTQKKKVAKTPEMLEWERKNKGKKKAIRSGETSM
ncbi:MAG: hypothetical protein ABL929_05115 [Ferruginibacter sp.]|nr:hypothetical protein [Ferruginibacter sp.]